MIQQNLLSIVISTAVSMFMLFCTCSNSVSGVETTNGFTVTATAAVVSGSAPPYSQIYLCDTGYIPFVNIGTGLQTSPDVSGGFSFAISPGSYKVVVFSSSGRSAAVSIAAPSAAAATHTNVSRHLEEPGTITGTITGPSDSLLVYLTGMSYYAVLSTNRTFSLSFVPPGTHRLRVIRLPAQRAESMDILHEESIVVTPGTISATGNIPLL